MIGKKEYYNMYQSQTTASIFVTVLEILKDKEVKNANCKIGSFYLPENIDIKTIYWLPPHIKQTISNSTIQYDDYYGTHELDENYDYEGPLLMGVIKKRHYFVYQFILDYNIVDSRRIFSTTDV